MTPTEPEPPLDLASLDLGDPTPVSGTDPRLMAVDSSPRLVDVSHLTSDERAAAERSAASIDFDDTRTLLSHGDGVLAEIAQASRQLLAGVRLGDAGEVGRIAAAVVDGVKILRIEDLQSEAGAPAARTGIFGRLAGIASGAHSAFRGFAESRKRFLDLMDDEQAKARRIKADLEVAVELLDRQSLAIRRSLAGLKIEIAAGQLALDRGEAELERHRLEAVRTGDPADAATVLERRGGLANFRGKVAGMRENLIGSALLVPIIAENRKAAETRIMKISNGMLVVLPRLMAVASQAAVQVDIRRAADESDKLDEAARQVTLLAARGAHDAAVSAARSLGEDKRTVEMLAAVADETIRTMHDVIDIEREVASADRDREARLAAIRDRLADGMRGVARHAIEP